MVEQCFVVRLGISSALSNSSPTSMTMRRRHQRDSTRERIERCLRRPRCRAVSTARFHSRAATLVKHDRVRKIRLTRQALRSTSQPRHAHISNLRCRFKLQMWRCIHVQVMHAGCGCCTTGAWFLEGTGQERTIGSCSSEFARRQRADVVVVVGGGESFAHFF
jgi:hypothetical protein